MRTSSIDYEREAFCLQDTDNDTTLQRFETFIQDQAGATKVDKSPSSNDEITGNLTESVTENLSLRVNDEARVTAALVDASKKKKTGSVFSVEVDLSRGEMVRIGGWTVGFVELMCVPCAVLSSLMH